MKKFFLCLCSVLFITVAASCANTPDIDIDDNTSSEEGDIISDTSSTVFTSIEDTSITTTPYVMTWKDAFKEILSIKKDGFQEEAGTYQAAVLDTDSQHPKLGFILREQAFFEVDDPRALSGETWNALVFYLYVFDNETASYIEVFQNPDRTDNINFPDGYCNTAVFILGEEIIIYRATGNSPEANIDFIVYKKNSGRYYAEEKISKSVNVVGDYYYSLNDDAITSSEYSDFIKTLKDAALIVEIGLDDVANEILLKDIIEEDSASKSYDEILKELSSE